MTNRGSYRLHVDSRLAERVTALKLALLTWCNEKIKARRYDIGTAQMTAKTLILKYHATVNVIS